jgi:predicted NUDIX family NTP pyrophosphohydrolase
MGKANAGRTSAGILLWRSREGTVEVLLAHNGGPYWARKDHGHWTIPKGEVEPGEELAAVALREFAEETGCDVPDGPRIDLGQIRQKSGKVVHGWAVEGDLDPATAVSNTYEMEWPPRSGRMQSFPEIDRVEWFHLEEARTRLKDAQVPFLDRLRAALADGPAREREAGTVPDHRGQSPCRRQGGSKPAPGPVAGPGPDPTAG